MGTDFGKYGLNVDLSDLKFNKVSKTGLFLRFLTTSNTRLVSSTSQYQKGIPAPVAQLVESLLRGMGGHGFDSGLRHTKVVKMVLAAPRLALRLTG